MPITARANREAGDAEAGAAASGNSTRATVSHSKASARLAAHGASAAASWWAEAPHSRGSGLNASAISSSQNRMWQQHGPCRTTRRTADGSRTAQIASHGRLTACRSRLVRYRDRADDRRASLFLRRGALCMLACVVPGILCASCRFPYCSVRHTSITLYLRIAHHFIGYTLPRTSERMCFGARIVELCGQMVDRSIFEAKPDFDAHLQRSRDST
jgi:hypothetical protein